jgi:hypothetical protein
LNINLKVSIMSYYKITFESDTIEGLKAIQGGFLGHGKRDADSTTFDTTVPPPRQQDAESQNVFSGVVQAPPTANEAGASLNKNAFDPPPPNVKGSATMDVGSQGEIPAPPRGGEGGEAQPNEALAPPKQPGSKSPNGGKKNSK